MAPAPKKEDPILPFATPKLWAAWLKKHHAQPEGLWIRHFKKASGRATVTYAEALDEALCWGWIDGQKKPFDSESWLQRYSPRRPRSLWSKRNREHVARLIKEERMRAPGLAQVRAAQADGRWAAAYDAASMAEVPADFIRALARHKGALAFFRTLNKANRYAISYRLQTAKKPETRARRFEALLLMMKEGKKLH